MTSPDTVEFRGAESLTLVADEWNRGAGGARPTILMLHGGGQNRFSWKNTGQILAGQRLGVGADFRRGALGNHAAAITEFAIELATDALFADASSAVSDSSDSDVDKAMSRFHNRLYAVGSTAAPPACRPRCMPPSCHRPPSCATPCSQMATSC